MIIETKYILAPDSAKDLILLIKMGLREQAVILSGRSDLAWMLETKKGKQHEKARSKYKGWTKLR